MTYQASLYRALDYISQITPPSPGDEETDAIHSSYSGKAFLPVRPNTPRAFIQDDTIITRILAAAHTGITSVPTPAPEISFTRQTPILSPRLLLTLQTSIDLFEDYHKDITIWNETSALKLFARFFSVLNSAVCRIAIDHGVNPQTISCTSEEPKRQPGSSQQGGELITLKLDGILKGAVTVEFKDPRSLVNQGGTDSNGLTKLEGDTLGAERLAGFKALAMSVSKDCYFGSGKKLKNSTAGFTDSRELRRVWMGCSIRRTYFIVGELVLLPDGDGTVLLVSPLISMFDPPPPLYASTASFRLKHPTIPPVHSLLLILITLLCQSLPGFKVEGVSDEILRRASSLIKSDGLDTSAAKEEDAVDEIDESHI